MTYFPTALPDRKTVANVSIEFLKTGQGRPLLFLHPATGPTPTAPFVRRLAAEFSVLMPAHPGFGTSSLPGNFSTVDDLAYFYLDLLEEVDLHDVVLVGVSFGSWIAAEIAVKSTARLSRLVLASPLGAKFKGAETREIRDLFPIEAVNMPKLMHADPQYHALDISKLAVEEVERIVRNRETLSLFGWAPTLYDPKLKQRLHRIKLPTLVLSGAQDQVVAADYAPAFVDAIAGAEFATIGQAGHYLHIDQPATFSDHVIRFANGTVADGPSGRGVTAKVEPS
jgi:pimeloyl-ACP methyl ester carboxylesterase